MLLCRTSSLDFTDIVLYIIRLCRHCVICCQGLLTVIWTYGLHVGRHLHPYVAESLYWVISGLILRHCGYRLTDSQYDVIYFNLMCLLSYNIALCVFSTFSTFMVVFGHYSQVPIVVLCVFSITDFIILLW